MNSNVSRILLLLLIPIAGCTNTVAAEENATAAAHAVNPGSEWLAAKWSTTWVEGSTFYSTSWDFQPDGTGTRTERRDSIYGSDSSYTAPAHWETTGATLKVDGVLEPIVATPNCLFLKIHGIVYRSYYVETCPLGAPALSERERKYIGSWRYSWPESSGYSGGFATLDVDENRIATWTYSAKTAWNESGHYETFEGYWTIDDDAMFRVRDVDGNVGFEARPFTDNIRVCAGECVRLSRSE